MALRLDKYGISLSPFFFVEYDRPVESLFTTFYYLSTIFVLQFIYIYIFYYLTNTFYYLVRENLRKLEKIREGWRRLEKVG